MLKGLGLAIAVISIAIIAAVSMPILHAVSVYREWFWEGGVISQPAVFHI